MTSGSEVGDFLAGKLGRGILSYLLLAAGLVLVGIGAIAATSTTTSSPANHIRSFRVSPNQAISGVISSHSSSNLALPFTPVSISIPSIGISSVNLAPENDHNGVLGTPRVQSGWGWWYGGALPGESQATPLLAGHINLVAHGSSSAEKIWNLSPGALATVYGASGRSRSYVAISLQSYPKSTLSEMATTLLSTTGPERLVIMTCGGTYNSASGKWSSSVVAVFVPVSNAVVTHSERSQT